MNVRITPRDRSNRTLLYGGVIGVNSDGRALWLTFVGLAWGRLEIPLKKIAEIRLDDDPGDWWD